MEISHMEMRTNVVSTTESTGHNGSNASSDTTIKGRDAAQMAERAQEVSKSDERSVIRETTVLGVMRKTEHKWRRGHTVHVSARDAVARRSMTR